MNEHCCPVCGNFQSLFVLCSVEGFSFFGCKVCCADHVFPMPSREMLKSYYDRQEWFEGGETGGYQNYDIQTAWSVDVVSSILEEFGGVRGLSVLDVGCGYGTHLDLAARLGWKCFGVELSDHARKIAQQRLDGNACIVENVNDLIPHEFDLIFMLDVIEHLPSPYPVFFSLFSIGAITPKTRIVISTPNAGSDVARQYPAEWKYRHPPSHLVYYASESLNYLLKKLHFVDINVKGVHPSQMDDRLDHEGIADFEGLLVTATGSDFTEFMRERYVPGTWSKIAEYEHFPRYELAKTMVLGKRVLDFGCGTGYGSAVLSGVATSVTGLDIDQSAISWANATHHHSGLAFHQCDDLGASLPDCAFDVVTCFEMIEHVNYETQQATIASIARLLRDDGLLIISTPNPEITKLYGANPYHLREMTLLEFHDLLGKHFPCIRILEQRVRNSIAFDEPAASRVSYELFHHSGSRVVPLAFIAFCSRQPVKNVHPLVIFDEEVDLIRDFLSHEKKLNVARFDAYRMTEKVAQLNDVMLAREVKSREVEDAFAKLVQSKWHRFGVAITSRPFTLGSFKTISLLFTSMIIPSTVRNRLRPIVAKWRRIRFNQQAVQLLSQPSSDSKVYIVKPARPATEDRPCIVHVIANFCIGGSSRLVVDLVELLGQFYEQKIVTSHIPAPPAYVGLDIVELRYPENEQTFMEYFARVKADLIHVHYWGDCDETWYAKSFRAAEQLGIPVIENINTPVVPYYSPAVGHYVYVSDYVRRIFGKENPAHITIYPGSDFSLFSRGENEQQAENCVGMVYRLERDKLDGSSILPFIRVVQKRPDTKVLIVGGGTLLEEYKSAVAEAGVTHCFEFTGYVAYTELPGLYRRMAVFASPVCKESFGQVSSFAMNMGIPVCGYDIGAIAEIINNRNLLAPAEDANRLADIIIRLLDTPDERRAAGNQQQQRASAHFSVQAMIRAYGEIYQQITGVPVK